MNTIQNLTIALAMLCTTQAIAQKGTGILDIDGSYDYQNFSGQQYYPTETLNNWYANFSLGKQFGNHFTAGIVGGFEYHQNLHTQYSTYYYTTGAPYYYPENKIYNTNTAKVGLFARYTYWISKRFYFYSQLNTGLLNVWTHENREVYSTSSPVISAPSPASDNQPRSGEFATLFPAIGMQLFHGYGVQVNIGGLNYTHYSDIANDGKYNHVNLNFGHQFTFGIHKTLGWKKANNKMDKPDNTQK